MKKRGNLKEGGTKTTRGVGEIERKGKKKKKDEIHSRGTRVHKTKKESPAPVHRGFRLRKQTPKRETQTTLHPKCITKLNKIRKSQQDNSQANTCVPPTIQGGKKRTGQRSTQKPKKKVSR